jgi:hypothetical protein
VVNTRPCDVFQPFRTVRGESDRLVSAARLNPGAAVPATEPSAPPAVYAIDDAPHGDAFADHLLDAFAGGFGARDSLAVRHS